MVSIFKRLLDLVEEVRWEDATSPSWWVKFARRQVGLCFYTLRETLRNRCLQQAAALTYTTLLSLVPLLAVAFSFFRAFEAFKGVQETAQRAIFKVVLAGPLVEGTPWRDTQESGEFAVADDAPAQEVLKEADDSPRRSGAAQAAWLYAEALTRGADPAAVREGLYSLYFGASNGSPVPLGRGLGPAQVRAYAKAAGVTIQEPRPKRPSRKDVRRYLESVSLDEPQDNAGWVGAEDQHRDREEAVSHYRAVARKLTDALVIYGQDVRDYTAREWIEQHDLAIQKLGESLLALGQDNLKISRLLRPEAPEAAAQSLNESIKNLHEAARLMEGSAEAEAALVDALLLADRREEALDLHLRTTEGSKELAARGLISVAVADYIRHFTERVGHAGIGVVGILILVVTSVSLLNTIEKTLNDIWQVKQKRPFWAKFTSFCTLIWLGPVLIGVSALVSERVAYQMVGALEDIPVAGAAFHVAATLAEYVVPFVTVWLLLVAVYKFLPYTRVEFRAAGWAAFVATVLIQLARPTYGLYVTHAIKYEKIYGSLGAVPIFLLWLWVLWLLVLFGAEVAFTIQNIGLLRFQDRLHRLSNVFIDRYLAVRIVLYVAREFSTSGKPMTVGQLADTLQISPEEAADAANRLANLGLLTPVGEQLDQFHPARSLSKLKVMDVLSISDRFRGDSRSPRPEDKPLEDKLEEVFGAAIASQQRALSDLTFGDLLDACAESGGQTA